MGVLIFESLEHQEQNILTNQHFDQLPNVAFHTIQSLAE
jgi:hypothetical protein